MEEGTLEKYIFYERKEGQHNEDIQNPWKCTRIIRMEWKGTKNINISHFVILLGEVGHKEMSLELFNAGWKRKTEKANWIAPFLLSFFYLYYSFDRLDVYFSLAMAERW